jgi:hypothetical protein
MLPFHSIKRHPGITRLRGTAPARLMYLESSAIVAALSDLMAQDIPALPVHDSIIVPAGL